MPFESGDFQFLIARELLGPDGTIEILEGTTVHPVWSIDRQDWIPLSELIEGEQLQSQRGPATVLTVHLSHSSAPVYNIEVHGEHVYQVGELSLLVHNAYPDDVLKALARKLHLNINSSTTRLLLEHVDSSVETLVSKFRQAKILQEFPSEVLKMPIDEALKDNTKVRKLLTDNRRADANFS